MAHIEVHQSIANHPKTKRLARELSSDVPTVIGHIVLLQHWAIDYAEDGNLSGHSAADIADGALWQGDPKKFLAALKRCGWVDADQKLHNWERYGGKYIKARNEGRERQAKYRAKLLGNEADNPKNYAEIDDARDAEVTRDFGVTHDHFSVSHNTDKRRGEERQGDPTKSDVRSGEESARGEAMSPQEKRSEATVPPAANDLRSPQADSTTFFDNSSPLLSQDDDTNTPPASTVHQGHQEAAANNGRVDWDHNLDPADRAEWEREYWHISRHLTQFDRVLARYPNRAGHKNVAKRAWRETFEGWWSDDQVEHYLDQRFPTILKAWEARWAALGTETEHIPRLSDWIRSGQWLHMPKQWDAMQDGDEEEHHREESPNGSGAERAEGAPATAHAAAAQAEANTVPEPDGVIDAAWTEASANASDGVAVDYIDFG